MLYIYSFNKYLLSTFRIQGTVLALGQSGEQVIAASQVLWPLLPPLSILTILHLFSSVPSSVGLGLTHLSSTTFHSPTAYWKMIRFLPLTFKTWDLAGSSTPSLISCLSLPFPLHYVCWGPALAWDALPGMSATAVLQTTPRLCGWE